MKNASSSSTLPPDPPYPQLPDERSVHQLLFDPVDYIPLALTPLEDPPPGQVRLVEPPTALLKDPDDARWLADELQRRRLLFEEALADGDPRLQQEQACQFAGLTHRLLWQRFRLPDFRQEPDFDEWMVGYLDLSQEVAEELRRRRLLVEQALDSGDYNRQCEQLRDFEEFRGRLLLQGPKSPDFRREFASTWWQERFLDLSVVREARELHERHEDALLALDLPRGRFELCPPHVRGKRLADMLVVSLRPVFDALAQKGLWVGTDRQFSELARMLIGLARDEHRRVREAATQPRAEDER